MKTTLTSIVIVTLSIGCARLPQHPVPGCVHPAAYTYGCIEDFRDGLALEHGQARVEHDTTEYRIQLAEDHLHAKKRTVRSRLDRFHHNVNQKLRRH